MSRRKSLRPRRPGQFVSSTRVTPPVQRIRTISSGCFGATLGGSAACQKGTGVNSWRALPTAMPGGRSIAAAPEALQDGAESGDEQDRRVEVDPPRQQAEDEPGGCPEHHQDAQADDGRVEVQIAQEAARPVA